MVTVNAILAIPSKSSVLMVDATVYRANAIPAPWVSTVVPVMLSVLVVQSFALSQ
jgi:hypothetical protein